MGGTFLLTDPFFSMMPGGGETPPGWDTSFSGGSSVYGFKDPPQATFLQGGIYPFTGEDAVDQYHWYDMRGSMTSPDFTIQFVHSFVVWFAFKVPNTQAAKIIECSSLTLPFPLFPAGQQIPLMSIAFEDDMSLSWYGGTPVVSFDPTNPLSVKQPPQRVGNTILDNSGFIANTRTERFIISVDTWYYAELSVDYSSDNTLPGDPVTIGGTLVINGELALKVQATPIATSGTDFPPSPGPYLSTISFIGSGELALALIFIQVAPAFDYPAPNPKVQIRENQALVEVAAKPIHDQVLINQGVVEVSELPFNSHVRISQMIIELPPGPPLGSGWQVKES